MTNSSLQWSRIAGVTAVQGAITLAWVLYALYLPQLLTAMGLAPELAGTLLILEHAIEVVVEPIAGHLSDRAQWQFGSRFSLITPGIMLATAFFLGLPTVVIFGRSLAWLLPTVAVLWASAMALFRSPAIALLAKSAPPVQLPIAASVLTFIQQLINALRFTAYGWILSLGAGWAFAIGSFVLLGAAAFLRHTAPPEPPAPEAAAKSPIVWPIVLLTISIAIGLAWGLRFLFATLSLQFQALLGEDLGWGLLGFSVTLAIAALPAGHLARQWGNRWLMRTGAIATAVLTVGLAGMQAWVPVWLVCFLLMGSALSAVLNGAIPLVLTGFARDRSGLALGFYFGAFGGGMSFFDLWFKGLTPGMWRCALAGAVCLLGVAIAIIVWERLLPPEQKYAVAPEPPVVG